MNELTPEDLEKFVRELFKPPPKGTWRMCILDGQMYGWKTGVAGSLKTTDDGDNWRELTVEEREELRKSFSS